MIIPNTLEQWILESEGKNILYRFFCNVMVNTVNLALAVVLAKYSYKILCRDQVVPKWLLNKQSGRIATCERCIVTSLAKQLNDWRKCLRWDRQVIESAHPFFIAGFKRFQMFE